MKLYVLIGGWDYEGYDNPVGVYSAKEKAESAKGIAYKHYDSIDVLEYELDASTGDEEP